MKQLVIICKFDKEENNNTMIKEAKSAIVISKRADEFNKFLKSYPQD